MTAAAYSKRALSALRADVASLMEALTGMYKQKTSLLEEMEKKYSILKEALKDDNPELKSGILEISSITETIDTIDFDISAAYDSLSRITGADIAAMSKIWTLENDTVYSSCELAKKEAGAALKKAAAGCFEFIKELSLRSKAVKDEFEELKKTEAVQRYLNSIDRKFSWF